MAPTVNKVIGEPLPRVDGPAKVTGAARYAAEFQLQDVVHAVLVGSTAGAGAITGFDLQAARGMPGVLAVVMPDNALKLSHDKAAPQAVTAPLLQDKAVQFNGQPIAIVVADTLERALAAAAEVRVSYQVSEPVTGMQSHLSDAYPPKHFRNGSRPPDSHRGAADAAFAHAPVKIEASYATPFEHHNPMEPHATIARWEGDRLTVWSATQGIAGTQHTLAGLFKLQPEQVQVICPFVGGGFGCKGNTWPPATLAAMAARMVGRPVKLVLTREQMYTNNGYRPQTIQRIRIGADKTGRLLAIRHDGFSSMSQPDLGEYSEPVALPTEMIYACPNVAIAHRIVDLNAPLPTYMRAPGEAPGMYALESAMDELAAALHIDPVELRLRNYAAIDPSENKPFASKALRACYRQGADAFGWSRRSPASRSMTADGLLVGWGMATSTYPTNRQAAAAEVRLHADGTAVVRSGTQDLGTGTYTVMTQIAAEALGLPVGRVRFELGDSRFPHAPVSGGSQTVASVGPAVRVACEQVRRTAFALARTHWTNADPARLRLQDGVIFGPAGQVRLADLLARQSADTLEARAEASPGEERRKHSMHAFGAQFAEVRVDPDLGTIRVTRFVGAFDCGRQMNALTVQSQLIGGITFGIGMALLEETRMDADTARFTNANLAEYLVPVNADIPDITAIVVNNPDGNSDPLGAKGVGELPMVGAAAVANAVWHATGRRVRKVPIRIEDVL